ncbi:DUF3576 domain-containing protein [Aestuariivita boseongensis]|uniref:DUF3576 domain-containing protein n=1 Tax=Aestuariivita boseongensis TaxID=1470562 RepID=UPI00067FA48E|nr:DUF3576 domain-containing protein [Aestuariivita boseongensis]
MAVSPLGKLALIVVLTSALTGCGGNGLFGRVTVGDEPTERVVEPGQGSRLGSPNTSEGSSLWDLFRPNQADQTVAVNRYLWNASLDVLNFLPVQSVDPFTGIIVTGYGTPPGGGRAYRATIHVTDPALEARALRVSLQTRSGPVSAGTARAVEDAILARARQLRIADNRF